jgi:hypothetical protein
VILPVMQWRRYLVKNLKCLCLSNMCTPLFSIDDNSLGEGIYGELTIRLMQKMTNVMIEYTNLSKDSQFIDGGCRFGKPNLHMAQYPGVDVSYGIKMEHLY